jgi:hypothetical protein
MGERVAGAHSDLHSDHGAPKGEHPGRPPYPIVKVHDIAWLEFEKPDLVRAEAFSRGLAFSTTVRTAEELYLRGTDAGSPCVLIQRGPRSRFVAAAYTAQVQPDVLRLADATGTRMRALPESLGGVAVDPVDPSGMTVRVVHGTHQLELRYRLHLKAVHAMIKGIPTHLQYFPLARAHHHRTVTVAPIPLPIRNPYQSDRSPTRSARPRGHGSGDPGKTERAALMANSLSGDRISVQ